MSEPGNSTALKRAKLMVGAIVGVLLIGAVVVLILRSFQAGALESSTALHAKQYVTTISPRREARASRSPAGNAARGHRIDRVRPQQRLRRALAQGHRQYGKKR
jgi:hypothetical protein